MQSFIEWLIDRQINESNQILTESADKANIKIPRMEMAIKLFNCKIKNFSIKNILTVLNEQYEIELKAEMAVKKRGLERPAPRTSNILRHRMTTYDCVYDAISLAYRQKKINICTRLKMEEQLFEQLRNILSIMLAALPNSFRLPNEEEVIYKADVTTIAKNRIDEKFRINQSDQMANNCLQPEPAITA